MNDNDNLLDDLEVTDPESILGAGRMIPPPKPTKHGLIDEIGEARDTGEGVVARTEGKVDRARKAIEPDRP